MPLRINEWFSVFARLGMLQQSWPRIKERLQAAVANDPELAQAVAIVDSIIEDVRD